MLPWWRQRRRVGRANERKRSINTEEKEPDATRREFHRRTCIGNLIEGRACAAPIASLTSPANRWRGESSPAPPDRGPVSRRKPFRPESLSPNLRGRLRSGGDA